MKYWIFLIVVVLFSSCNNRNINTLKHEKLSFKDLPVEIFQYLKNPTEVQDDIQAMILELPKGKNNDYRLETVNTWIGPWVAYEKLININKNITYKIERGVPDPYIIFDNKLYVPDRYNIFTTVDDLNSLEFTRYELK